VPVPGRAHDRADLGRFRPVRRGDRPYSLAIAALYECGVEGALGMDGTNAFSAPRSARKQRPTGDVAVLSDLEQVPRQLGHI